jgi:large subunit ribosomal protein L21
MYAIIDIAGQQFKVTQAQKLKVHRLEAEEGKTVELGNVLLMSDGKSITVGTPTVDGARIAATVISHSKGDKVLVFKKKRRKGYQKLNGHRQYITELWIEAILGKGEKFDASKSSAPKRVVKVTQPAKKAKVVKAEVAVEAPAKKAAPKKAAAAKKAAPKKAAAKKAAPKKDDKK